MINLARIPTAISSPVALAVVFLLSGCSSSETSQLSTPVVDTLANGAIAVENEGPTGWTDTAAAWRIEEGLRIGGLDGSEGELINPLSVALDAVGRVYVVDQRPAVIKVYGRDGVFLKTIGREGEGPGEFRVGFITIRGANLVLHDPRVARTTVFDTSGVFVRSWRSACCVWTQVVIDEASRVVIPSMVSDDAIAAIFLRYELTGEAIDTVRVAALGKKQWWILRDKGSIARINVPLAASTIVRLSPTGEAVYGWSGRYQLLVSETGPDTVRLFGRAWTPTPISTARREALVREAVTGHGKGWGEAAVRDVIRLSDVPTEAPAYLGIAVDRRGFYWVQLDIGDDSTSTPFDVFDQRGVYLGPVLGPASLRRLFRASWARDDVAVIAEDEEGVPIVAVYRIVRRGWVDPGDSSHR